MFLVAIMNSGIPGPLQLSRFNVQNEVGHCFVRKVVKTFRLQEAVEEVALV